MFDITVCDIKPLELLRILRPFLLLVGSSLRSMKYILQLCRAGKNSLELRRNGGRVVIRGDAHRSLDTAQGALNLS